MRKNLFLWIGGVVLFALAQIPAFLAWTIYTGPWETALGDMDVLNAVIGAAFVVFLGAVIFAFGLFAVVLTGRLIRRIVGMQGRPGDPIRQLIASAGIVVGCGLAAAIEFGAVTLMKSP
ncbi:MAG: hypothetical protein HY876_08950 [Coriobacteriales bacterium]|nr:hypothetical protein [Coriobacteriales bacterium]